jgi:hypothetical protein
MMPTSKGIGTMGRVDFEEFEASLREPAMPPGLPGPLQVLWLDARGDWTAAHELAQRMRDDSGARLHAYLHREEGDLPNAGYWYRRAGVDVPDCDLDAEWRQLVGVHLAGSRSE